MSLKDVMIRSGQILPPTSWVTAETIRRYEAGLVPEHKANPVLLAALATIYRVPLRELSDVAADSVDRLIELLTELSSASKVVHGAGKSPTRNRKAGRPPKGVSLDETGSEGPADNHRSHYRAHRSPNRGGSRRIGVSFRR